MINLNIVLEVIISNINEAAVYFFLAIISGILLFCSCLLGHWLSAKLSPPPFPIYPQMLASSKTNQDNLKSRTFPSVKKQWTPDHTYTQCPTFSTFSPEETWCLKESQCCDRPAICSKDNEMAESLSGIEEDYQYSMTMCSNVEVGDVKQPQWRFYRLPDGRKETLV